MSTVFPGRLLKPGHCHGPDRFGRLERHPQELQRTRYLGILDVGKQLLPNSQRPLLCVSQDIPQVIGVLGSLAIVEHQRLQEHEPRHIYEPNSDG